MPNAIKPKKSVLFAYLIIPVVIFVFSVFVPLVTAFVYSFFQWKGGPVKTFNGLTNYITLLKDSTFWLSFRHNIFLVLVCIVGQIGIAFIFVLMINSKLVKLKGIHRTFGFFPSTISAVSIGFIWKMIYDYNRGLINWFLDKIGRAVLQQVWLNNESLVMLRVAIPRVWQWIGYYIVILLSAISSIDQEIFEVAQL